MFKVRSRTDVITNSSSEVFIMKVKDWDDFMEWLTNSNLEDKDYLERSLRTNTKVYHSIDDVKRIRKPPYGIDLKLPTTIPPSASFALSPFFLQILVDLGHTVEEVREYIEKKDKEYWDKVLKDPEWNKLIGYAYGSFDHWNSCVEHITKWMKKNNRKYIEHYND